MSITPKTINAELLNSVLVSAKNTVECKLSVSEEEIPAITNCLARASLDETEVLNGEIRYGGRVTFCAILSSGGLKKCEAGVEFSFKQELQGAVAGDILSAVITVENVKVSSNNGIPTATAVVLLKGTLFKKQPFSYACEIDNFYSKKSQVESATLTGCGKKVFDLEDEFDIDFAVNEVLWHGENLKVKSVTAGIGSVSIEGDAEISIAVLTDDGKLEFTKKEIPFNFEHELKSVMPSSIASSFLSVSDANLKVVVDSAKTKSSVGVLLKISACTCAYDNEQLVYLSDAYSQTECLTFEKDVRPIKKLIAIERFEKAFNVQGGIKFEKSTLLLCPLFAKIEERDISQNNGGLYLKGVLKVGALVSCDGVYALETALLPFETSVDFDNGALLSLDVCNFNVTAVERGVDVDFTLVGWVEKSQTVDCQFIREVSKVKQRKASTSAISVFIPTAGDLLWDVAKSLGVSEEEVLKTNPDLQFPLSGEERIVIYREIK